MVKPVFTIAAMLFAPHPVHAEVACPQLESNMAATQCLRSELQAFINAADNLAYGLEPFVKWAAKDSEIPEDENRVHP